MNKLMISMRKAALVCIVLSLWGCGSMPAVQRPALSSANPTAGFNYAQEEAAPAEVMPAAPLPQKGEIAKSVPQESTKRLVIKNVDMSVVAEDPIKSMKAFAELAERLGGFVVESNQYKRMLPDGKEVPQGNITIRVPAEKLDEVLEEIKNQVVEVQHENISGQDVTQEYTDLQSRLRNLEAAEKELKRIMEQAYSTEDVMNVYNQLVQIREQIEVVKGQIQYYEKAAALSAIKIEIIAKATVQPVTIGGWQPVGVARDAIQALIEALKGVITAAIWLVLFVLPLLIVIAIPFVILFYILRRFWKRRKASKALQSESGMQPQKEEEKPS